MNHTSRRTLCLTLLSALALLAAPCARAQWTVPTAEELSMTSQPEVPGAAAVYLFREETTEDKLRVFTIYERIKVLNNRGKEFANVELPLNRGSAFTSVDDIQGRTIHPDGTIIPFKGKPYETQIERSQGNKVAAKVFTLPDVEVGSIIEYRYKLHYSDKVIRPPQWFLQSSLWTRQAHYLWKPLDLSGGTFATSARGERINTILWTPILPSGAEVKQTKVLGNFGLADQNAFELNVKDIPPAPHDAYMPPIASFTYRVLFYFSSHRSSDEFWREEGKHWAAEKNKLIGPGPLVTAATRSLVSGSDAQDQKLRKIYAAVMQLENTSFAPPQSTGGNSQSTQEIHSTEDVWNRKQGTNDQLTELFVAMARAAGMKAYLAAVTNRDHNLFLKEYLTLSQLNGYLAIVTVDGKESFFVPGARYCPYGHLVWQQTQTSGIRQTEDGADFLETPSESYDFSRVQRVANLTMDDNGNVTGTIKMTFMGYANLGWRQSTFTGGTPGLEQALQKSLERQIPRSLEAKFVSIENEKPEDYEQPLIAHFEVKGSLGSSTGKRRLILADLFEANSKPSFPSEKRDIPVYFQYPRTNKDAVRISFPATFSVEALPSSDQSNLHKVVAYDMQIESTPTSFTAHRDYVLGKVLFNTEEYADLRSFYSKFENKDQETVVLTTSPAPAKPTPAGN
jgi:hypothetical protein